MAGHGTTRSRWAALLLVACLVPMTWAGWGAARDAVLATGEQPRAVSPVWRRTPSPSP